MLFLAGLAFVNLRSMRGEGSGNIISTDQLTDSAWRPTVLGEMPIDEDTRIFIQFGADGRTGGHGGCNRFFGDYELNEGKLDFGMLGATRMACGEPADSFEISFLEALENTTSAVRAGNRLAFRDAQDRILLRFDAVPRRDE